MRYCTDRSFETGDFFKLKNGFVTFILGLIYHSMALSQLQSLDTVPLKGRNLRSIEWCQEKYLCKSRETIPLTFTRLKKAGSIPLPV
jgi:hypothetical protein